MSGAPAISAPKAPQSGGYAQKGRMAWPSAKQASDIAPGDINALAALVLEGLREHLTGNLQAGLERLLREQEHRLLAALVPVCSANAPKDHPLAAAGNGEVKGHHAHGHLLSPNSPYCCNLSPNSPKPTPAHALALGKQPEAVQRIPSAATFQRIPSAATTEWPHEGDSKADSHWLRWPWQLLRPNHAQVMPSDVKSLGDARDSELLAMVPPLPGGCALELPGAVAKHRRRPTGSGSSRRASPKVRDDPGAGHSLEEQLSTLGTPSDGTGSPSAISAGSLGQCRPPPKADSLSLRQAQELATALTAESAFAMDRPRSNSPKCCTPMWSSQPQAQGAEAQCSAANRAAVASASAASDRIAHGQEPVAPASAAAECNSPRRASEHCLQRACPQPVPQNAGCSPATDSTAAAAPVQQQSAASQAPVAPTSTARALEDGCRSHAAPWKQRRFTNPSVSTMSPCGTTVNFSTFDSVVPPASTQEWDRSAAEPVSCGMRGLAPLRPSSDPQVARASTMDMKALRLSREDELLARASRPQTPAHNSDNSDEELVKPGSRRWRKPSDALDTQSMRSQQEEAVDAKDCASDPGAMQFAKEGQLLDGSESEVSFSEDEDPGTLTTFPPPALGGCMGQRLDSPLVLRLCGILHWGRHGEAYCCLMVLVATVLVATFAWQFYRVQRRNAGPADCPGGICLHFGYLSDLVLAVGSLLGLMAMHRLRSLRLLGCPTTLLVSFATEHQAVRKWSRSTSWFSLCLATLWLGSIAFRAATMPTDPGCLEVVQACAFALTSLIFMAVVFSVLHMNCCICVLIDNYALRVREDKDLIKGTHEWDRLAALLRRVACGAEWGFSLVQTTSMIMLVCSILAIMLQGEMPIWWFISNVLLAKGLVLLIFKAAEVTEKCARMPSLINNMNFDEDNDFSMQKHYLVEHIAYSDAGFYVGEVRLTAKMVLRIMYGGLLASFGVLARLTAV